MLGINNAIKLIQHINFYDMYDHRVSGCKHVSEIEDFDYEWLLNYLSNLEIPYEVLKDFFEYDLTFASIDNVAKDDEPDYLVIDNDGIYCWTEVFGITYHLKDYGVKWKEYVEPPLSEEDKLKEEIRRKEFEKLFAEQLKEMYDKVLPKLVADDMVTVKPMGDFRKFAMDVTNKEENE